VTWEWAAKFPSCQRLFPASTVSGTAAGDRVCSEVRAEFCATVADCNGIPIGTVFSYNLAELDDYDGGTVAQ